MRCPSITSKEEKKMQQNKRTVAYPNDFFHISFFFEWQKERMTKKTFAVVIKIHLCFRMFISHRNFQFLKFLKHYFFWLLRSTGRDTTAFATDWIYFKLQIIISIEWNMGIPQWRITNRLKSHWCERQLISF